eukprot:Plantae.Rhodophyta-Purpureofilum_apyrenoidigerum.ctg3970.p1 GENE.Plantae.Rhodophyta-Purpureofilum_apyrenoidigerum.ctg3970~~Plantae.Rhodophyta-Purpureofilum_apyrenoidigerum.ctg3970.p1  ORF type:complete len:184 (-),score=17.18 Plantae.Rhodophyta-Purpureofilum_apyrenoidigerum.ctg3970:222-773(-)
MNYHPRMVGFANAPVTQAMITGTFLASLAYMLEMRLAPFIETIFIPFAFQHPLELANGLFLLYHFRQFERQIGSTNFGIYVTTAFLMSEGLYLALVKARPDANLATGPYGVIFALLTYYFIETPVTLRYNFFGLQLTNKTCFYALSLPLILFGGSGAFAAATAGVFTGLLLLSRSIGGYSSPP